MIKEYPYVDPKRGMRIITTGDPDKQVIIEKFIAENCERVDEKDIKSAPVTILDAVRVNPETKVPTGSGIEFIKLMKPMSLEAVEVKEVQDVKIVLESK